jgi:alpha,alpha-trehalose phosphorylase
MAALLMDLADAGGNVKDGCHIASMGGTWMMLTYGFGGMRDDDGTLSFWPRRAPEDNAILRFPPDVSRGGCWRSRSICTTR